jgi:hypothetical protein
MLWLSFCLLTVYCPTVNAQFRLAEEVEVYIDGEKLSNPWAGGINQPQISSFDLNNDGFEDLVIFDKSGGVYLTFLNEGILGSELYVYDPSYEPVFPVRADWALFKDYNGDGLPDLFSYTAAGFGVWKAMRDAESGDLSFDLVNNQVQYQDGASRSPVFTSRADLPGFADINGDGDLDIITFGTFGGFVRYFENLTVENGWDPDSLLFEFTDNCWGNWFESSLCNGGDLNVSCFGKPPEKELEDLIARAHAGSTVLPLDNDQDGDVDLLLGDAGCPNLVLLRNGGNASSALITGQDTIFPSETVQASFETFLAAFDLDVNQDGKRDLLVAPNDDSEARNARNIWYYRNISADSLVTEFVQEDFLGETMVDEGAETRVCFADLSGDGLADILVGRLNRRDSESEPALSGLTYFRNIGTADLASFEWVTSDYAGASSLGRQSLAPATGDLDGDGDLDLLLGDAGGNLHFFRNQAGPGNPADLVLDEMDFQGINFGVQSTPALFDLNRDGLLDLVLGERNGNLNYLRNIGTVSAPVFLLESEFWGQVDTRRSGLTVGSSSPFLRLNEGNQIELYVGSQSGYIYRYSNLDGNLSGTFTLEDSSWGGLNPGQKSSLAMGDMNGDGLVDVLVGNIRGGIQLFTGKDVEPPIGLPMTTPPGKIRIWPNPARDVLFVDWSDILSGQTGNQIGAISASQDGDLQWSLMRSDGTITATGSLAEGFSSKPFQIDVSNQPGGLYFISIQYSNVSYFSKVSLIR